MHQDIDFEAIVANIVQVVIVLDPNLTIVWANRKAAEAAGRDPIGLKCYRIYQGRENPCDGCHTLKTFRTGEMLPNQSTVTSEDGSQRRFDGFTIPVGSRAKYPLSRRSLERCRPGQEPFCPPAEKRGGNPERGPISRNAS